MSAATFSLTARRVFPVAGPPIANGVLTVAGGTIAAVERHGRADLDLGNAAILPGLVNAHTHLDLSGMRGLAPPSPDFTGWLRRVIAHRRARTPEQVQADVRAGLAECVRTGTTLVGDISGDGSSSYKALVTSGIRAVIFRELIGLPRERALQAMAAAEDWLDTFGTTNMVRPGLSPHAPYSANEWLYEQAAAACERLGLPLASHLAESREEIELLERRTGLFVGFLSELGVWDPAGLAPDVNHYAWICQRAPVTLFAHANFADPLLLALPRPAVVYCPRTHAAFGHPPHPFREFLAHGIRVALGTDSLASNPDLDLLAEARFLRQRTDVPGETLLRMATLSGAEALGWGNVTGSLEPGKSADLVVVPLPDRDSGDPHDLVLASDLPVSRVMCRGTWLAEPAA
jgi:cytosine/adenosine deaminase-related metal-dependent hydrolase